MTFKHHFSYQSSAVDNITISYPLLNYAIHAETVRHFHNHCVGCQWWPGFLVFTALLITQSSYFF